MPYPESCPECGGTFRNTGTHFTARRNEVGRHVLLELGCQTASRRFWWDFTSGSLSEDGQASTRRLAASAANLTSAAATNGAGHAESNGHAGVATIEEPKLIVPDPSDVFSAAAQVLVRAPEPEPSAQPSDEMRAAEALGGDVPSSDTMPREARVGATESAVDLGTPIELPATPPANLKEAFVRQLQLDRLTLRQMRSWLMSEEARRAIEVAAGATEATYERLALILFGADLPQLLGKQAAAPAPTAMSAEERLELQREKARIRARLRRAAAKAARESTT
jgi:hypothetical protein